MESSPLCPEYGAPHAAEAHFSLAVERFLRDGEVTVVAVDRQQVDRALDGWRRFGKGRRQGGAGAR